MGTTRHGLTFFGTLLLAGTALTGCTAPAPEPSQALATSDSAPSKAVAPNAAIIFEVQKSQVERAPMLGTVLKQYSGTGPATLDVGILPEGQKKLGATVICSGTGDWKVRIVGNRPGWGSSACSLAGGNSMAYPVDTPGKESTVQVEVAADVNVWVTVFSTK